VPRFLVDPMVIDPTNANVIYLPTFDARRYADPPPIQ
jgi:hypothetical protein